MRNAAGDRIGPYEIFEWLGSGGMGDVYRARDPRLERDVAVKVISGTGAADPERTRRFEQEARLTGRLNHPNILAVYDVGTHEGVPYLVSELLEGESMRALLLNGPISVHRAVDYARQAADGLAAAHDQGIVHRDLKPENLFITADRRLKILDFGVAKLVERGDDTAPRPGAATETLTGVIVGTAAYMSPEQVRGEALDGRSDIFSLGAVLYEMLTGRAAFLRGTGADTMAAVLKEEPAALAEEIPIALRQIVSRCLEKDRTVRSQSARDLTFGLQYLSGSTDMGAATGADRRWTSRLPLVASTAAGVLLVIAIGAWVGKNLARPADHNLLVDAEFTQVTNADASNLDAAISPDGSFVAYISDQGGPFRVMVTRVGSNVLDELTPGPEHQQNPSGNRSVGFSPDAASIWLARRTDPSRRLSLMPVTGGPARAFLAELAVNVVWTADGARLAYFTSEDGDPIFVADALGGNPRQILVGRKGEHNHFPAWSTDGEWIYYVHGVQTTFVDIWRIRSTGGQPERLTQLNTDIKYLSALDGRTLLFVAPDERRAGPWLWALDVERRTVRRVSIGLERYLSIAASADGKRLAATVGRSSASLWTVPISDDADEGDVKPYGPPIARALAPRFGGGSLFFLSANAPGDGLWRFQDGTLEEIWKGSNGALLESSSVSPDGSRVAILRRLDGRLQLTALEADGSSHRSIATSIAPYGTSSWSPDSKWIVTGGTDGDQAGLFKIPTDGGTSVRLVTGPAYDPVWSGDLIVYVASQNADAPLRAVTSEGKDVPLPAASIPPRGGGRVRFMPRGDAIVYVQGSPGMQDFWMLDLKTRRPRQITRLADRATIGTFDITPDGQHIVFDRIREDSEVRIIDLRK